MRERGEGLRYHRLGNAVERLRRVVVVGLGDDRGSLRHHLVFVTYCGVHVCCGYCGCGGWGMCGYGGVMVVAVVVVVVVGAGVGDNTL